MACVGEGHGGEGVGDEEEDASDESDGFLFGFGDFVVGEQDGSVEEGDAYEEVAGEFAELFVVVDGVFDELRRMIDDIFGGFSGEDGAEEGEGAQDQEEKCGVEPTGTVFLAEEPQDDGDPDDHEDAYGEVDGDGVEAFEWGEGGESEHDFLLCMGRDSVFGFLDDVFWEVG